MIRECARCGTTLPQEEFESRNHLECRTCDSLTLEELRPSPPVVRKPPGSPRVQRSEPPRIPRPKKQPVHIEDSPPPLWMQKRRNEAAEKTLKVLRDRDRLRNLDLVRKFERASDARIAAAREGRRHG